MPAKTKVVNTDLVYRELTNVNARDRSAYGLNHYSKFSFKKVVNNIIRGRFISGGVSSSQYVSNVEKFKDLLSNVFGNVEITHTDLSYQLVIKRKAGGQVIVNFYYIDTEILRDINEGQLYERQMIQKLRNANYTTQLEAEEVSGQDVTITVNDVSVGIELKEKPGAAFGSATLEFTGGHWRLKPSTKQNPAIPSIVTEVRALEKINQQWYINKGNYVPNLRATKQDQQILGEVRIPIQARHIREYYKKCDYINIKGKGLYKLKSDDPLNLGATLFDPTDSYIRVRVQDKSNTYRYALELYMGTIRVSSIRTGLDGDLRFLEG